MTQTAKVREILSPGIAMVAVKRVSACAHDCSKCASGGCMMMEHPDLTVRAYNEPNARVGDVVLVESSSKSILSMAAIVYLLPFVFMFVGYAIGGMLGMGETISLVIAFVCFAVSFLIPICLNKRMQNSAVQFHITRIISQI